MKKKKIERFRVNRKNEATMQKDEQVQNFTFIDLISGQICYGIIYGIGAKKLAQELNVRLEEAEKFLNDFKHIFPRINIWIRDTLSQFRARNFLTTVTGRRKTFSARNSKLDRQIINTTIQGSAADIFKLAIINIDKNLLMNNNYANFCKFLLQIHDELIFELKNEFLDEISRKIKFEMENCFNLKNLNLAAKLKFGDDWGEMEISKIRLAKLTAKMINLQKKTLHIPYVTILISRTQVLRSSHVT
uniref:DNA-directed DNA polymerase family A palm domain-containing protein n=1 Tax=Romanomermis culicivorax TaxID=13658 RepID=A0A915JRX2_ROMCU